MCCAHHVGIKFVNKLLDCKKTCNGLLNGIENQNDKLLKEREERRKQREHRKENKD
jgi:hypothetical protein